MHRGTRIMADILGGKKCHLLHFSTRAVSLQPFITLMESLIALQKFCHISKQDQAVYRTEMYCPFPLLLLKDTKCALCSLEQAQQCLGRVPSCKKALRNTLPGQYVTMLQVWDLILLSCATVVHWYSPTYLNRRCTMASYEFPLKVVPIYPVSDELIMLVFVGSTSLVLLIAGKSIFEMKGFWACGSRNKIL